MTLDNYISFCSLLLKWGVMSSEHALNLAVRQVSEELQTELLDLACYLEETKVRYEPLTKAEKFVLNQKMERCADMEVKELLQVAKEWFEETKKGHQFGDKSFEINSGLNCLRLAVLKARYTALGTEL